MHFFCDTMRTLLAGGVEVHDLDQVMETDLEVLHQQSRLPAARSPPWPTAFRASGIVAAVLGVVITMGSLGGPPEEIGHKVAAALVGTFLGILLCYGFLGPMAANIKKQTRCRKRVLPCLRMGSAGVHERRARRSWRWRPRGARFRTHVRPTFQEMDKACRKPAAAAPVARRQPLERQGKAPDHHRQEEGRRS